MGQNNELILLTMNKIIFVSSLTFISNEIITTKKKKLFGGKDST